MCCHSSPSCHRAQAAEQSTHLYRSFSAASPMSMPHRPPNTYRSVPTAAAAWALRSGGGVPLTCSARGGSAQGFTASSERMQSVHITNHANKRLRLGRHVDGTDLQLAPHALLQAVGIHNRADGHTRRVLPAKQVDGVAHSRDGVAGPALRRGKGST